ncbi:hypothetical protein RQP46_005667 [Phenoliferia psychrophenolica]
MALEDDKQWSENVSRTPSGSGSAEDDEAAVEVGLRSWLAVFSGCMCVFLGYFLGIMMASFTPYVVAELGGATSITIVTLALAAFLCAVADILGRGNILIVGMLICAIGCIVIATAQSIGVVIIGSVLTAGNLANQGNFYTIPSEVLPRRYRGLASTLTAASGGVGSIICYLVNGSFIRSYPMVGWRYGYYVACGLSLLTAASLHFFYTPIRKTDKTLLQVILHEVDLVGTGLLVTFATVFVIGLNWGGNAYAWSSVQCIATLAVGGAFLLLLIIHQVFIKKDGLFHHDLFANRNYWLSAFGLFIEGVVFLVFLLFYPLMTNILYETRPFNQAIRLIPFWGAFTVTAPLIGVYTRRNKDLKNPLIIGWVSLLVSAIAFSTLRADQGQAAIGLVVLAGAGFAAPLALLNASAQLAVPKHLLGLATGQIIACRAFGAMIGAVIFVTIFTAKSATILPASVAAAAIKAGLPVTSVTAVVTGILTQNSTLTMSAPGVTPAILAAAGGGVLDGYASAFHFGWYASIPFLVVGLVIAIALDGPAIKNAMTWAVDNPVEVIHHVGEHGDAKAAVEA